MNILDAYLMMKMVDYFIKPWESFPAYKLGIINKNGKPLKKSSQLKTHAEKSAYGILQRLCFRMRRLIESLPGGKTKLFKYISVYSLFKESNESEINMEFISEFTDLININSEFEHDMLMRSILHKGTYRLVQDMLSSDGKIIKQDTLVIVPIDQKTQMILLGKPVFEVLVGKRKLMVSGDDISDDLEN
jgi:hypothetical protein